MPAEKDSNGDIIVRISLFDLSPEWWARIEQQVKHSFKPTVRTEVAKAVSHYIAFPGMSDGRPVAQAPIKEIVKKNAKLADQLLVALTLPSNFNYEFPTYTPDTGEEKSSDQTFAVWYALKDFEADDRERLLSLLGSFVAASSRYAATPSPKTGKPPQGTYRRERLINNLALIFQRCGLHPGIGNDPLEDKTRKSKFVDILS